MRNRSILLAGGVLAALTTALLLELGATNPEPLDVPAPRAVVASSPPPPALRDLAAASERDREPLLESSHRALVEALRADPAGTLAELERFLAGADPAKTETQVAMGALVAVGTPEIQRTLVKLVEIRATDDRFAQLAIPTIAFLAKPTVDTEEAVRGFTRDDRSETMRGTAHLALGIMATQLSADNTRRAAAIVDDYAARLATAQTVDERRRWLQVLGNARTEGAAAAISTQLGERDPAVRSRAVDALRLAPAADVDGKLAHALGDEDASVRESAARSFSYRKASPAMIDSMLARLDVEPEPRVATVLLATIWSRRAEAADRVVAAVERFARTHASAEVRESARRLLDGTRS